MSNCCPPLRFYPKIGSLSLIVLLIIGCKVSEKVNQSDLKIGANCPQNLISESLGKDGKSFRQYAQTMHAGKPRYFTGVLYRGKTQKSGRRKALLGLSPFVAFGHREVTQYMISYNAKREDPIEFELTRGRLFRDPKGGIEGGSQIPIPVWAGELELLKDSKILDGQCRGVFPVQANHTTGLFNGSAEDREGFDEIGATNALREVIGEIFSIDQ